jgi:GAF domain-containing protein
MTAGTGPGESTDRGEQDLRASLSGLAQLLTGRMELEEALTRVAEYAVIAIPGAEGAGLTLLAGGRPDAIVASSQFVVDVDAVQYGINEGPCITAAAERRTVRSGSLGADRQWPRFGRAVQQLGVHSALSLPLVTEDGLIGAMNVYAHAYDAFSEHSAEVGEQFAIPAAVAVQNARILAQARTMAQQLQVALTNRAVIDQAKGILISRIGCTPDEAFERLRVISQSQNLRLHAVAQSIVDQAVRRARAWHVNDPQPPDRDSAP